ncbi:putative Vicilin-like antimicrobial peptides 2-1 [Cocos nucifera]|uniref:Putative Vicilin-like antimicrobial peptides 2-1 n=1 Tax=Cocos nucifera TaxID=13894 RepID=A0A8K0IXI2_COCNU|nr:putative Vicilin-like antimicrobial peptides 2-1 [Cocos nucifera]
MMVKPRAYIPFLLLLSILFLSATLALSSNEQEDPELKQCKQQCRQQPFYDEGMRRRCERHCEEQYQKKEDPEQRLRECKRECRESREGEQQRQQCERRCEQRYQEERRGGEETGRHGGKREDPEQRLQECKRECRESREGEQQRQQCERRCEQRYQEERREGEETGRHGGKREDPEKRLEECRRECREKEEGRRQQRECEQRCEEEYRKHRGGNKEEEEREEEKEKQRREGDPYFFDKESFVHRLRTEHGNIRVFRNFFEKSELLLGVANYRVAIIETNPNTFVLPSHFDAEALLFVARGNGILTLMRQDNEEAHELRRGDIMRVHAGAIASLMNKDRNEKLVVVCLLQPVATPGMFEAFVGAGGQNPESFYRSFSKQVLRAAFNTREDKLERLFEKQQKGPIIQASQEQIRELSRQISED